jgi:hypothetical protein
MPASTRFGDESATRHPTGLTVSPCQPLRALAIFGHRVVQPGQDAVVKGIETGGVEMTARQAEGAPSVLAVSITLIDDDTARALVDEVLGLAEEWFPPLMSYRLRSDDQDDWKAELGNALFYARREGFLNPLVTLLKGQANKEGFSVDGPPNINDRGHTKFHRELAPATVAYYLSGTGWSFERWEPKDLPGDVDLLMLPPTGESVAFQIKGSGRHAGSDEDIVTAIEHARDQLRVCQPTVVAICPQTALHLTFHPGKILSALFGRTIHDGSGVFLPKGNRGHFFTEAWSHVGAVLLLDFVRGIERGEQTYASTVLMNPLATRAHACSPEWFPYSRILLLEGDRFCWHNGAPNNRSIPAGTLLLG